MHKIETCPDKNMQKKTQFSVVKFSFSLDSWQHDLTNPFEVGFPSFKLPNQPH